MVDAVMLLNLQDRGTPTWLSTPSCWPKRRWSRGAWGRSSQLAHTVKVGATPDIDVRSVPPSTGARASRRAHARTLIVPDVPLASLAARRATSATPHPYDSAASKRNGPDRLVFP